MGKLLPSELLERGWTRGAMFHIGVDGTKVRYCLAGAADEYEPGNFRDGANFQDCFLAEAATILMDQGEYIPNVVASLVSWNDRPERTQEEVVALAKEVEARLGLRPVATTPKPDEEPVPEPTPEPEPEPEPEGDEPPFVEQEKRVLVGVGD